MSFVRTFAYERLIWGVRAGLWNGRDHAGGPPSV